jgi:hypothetical protein
MGATLPPPSFANFWQLTGAPGSPSPLPISALLLQLTAPLSAHNSHFPTSVKFCSSHQLTAAPLTPPFSAILWQLTGAPGSPSPLSISALFLQLTASLSAYPSHPPIFVIFFSSHQLTATPFTPPFLQFSGGLRELPRAPPLYPFPLSY